MLRLISAIFGLVMLLAFPALAESIEISAAQIRATAPGMTATGGYLTITNHGDTDDRLISASAGFAGKVEIHEMIQDGDVMRMRQREGGIIVPAHGMVMLKPGGLHLMIMGLKETLAPGQTREISLEFESGHRVTLPAMVLKPGEIGVQNDQGHDHSHNNGHDHNHNHNTGSGS